MIVSAFHSLAVSRAILHVTSQKGTHSTGSVFEQAHKGDIVALRKAPPSDLRETDETTGNTVLIWVRCTHLQIFMHHIIL